MYIDSSIKKYLDDLSAKLPTPGGGSAAALVSATGVSCLLMVVNFSIGKRGYEQEQDELKKIAAKLSTLNSQLSTLIDEDVDAYAKLSKAYQLPKDTTEEKEMRSKKIQESLKMAMEVPWKILLNSLKASAFCDRLREIGNKNLISDVDCGESFLRAAIDGARINIEINLKSISDSSFVSEKETELKKILEAL